MSRTPKITRAARRIRDTYSLPLTTAKVIAQALHQRGWLDGDHEDAIRFAADTAHAQGNRITPAEADAALTRGETLGVPVRVHAGRSEPVYADLSSAANLGSIVGAVGQGRGYAMKGAFWGDLATMDPTRDGYAPRASDAVRGDGPHPAAQGKSGSGKSDPLRGWTSLALGAGAETVLAVAEHPLDFGGDPRVETATADGAVDAITGLLDRRAAGHSGPALIAVHESAASAQMIAVINAMREQLRATDTYLYWSGTPPLMMVVDEYSTSTEITGSPGIGTVRRALDLHVDFSGIEHAEPVGRGELADSEELHAGISEVLRAGCSYGLHIPEPEPEHSPALILSTEPAQYTWPGARVYDGNDADAAAEFTAALRVEVERREAEAARTGVNAADQILVLVEGVRIAGHPGLPDLIQRCSPWRLLRIMLVVSHEQWRDLVPGATRERPMTPHELLVGRNKTVEKRLYSALDPRDRIDFREMTGEAGEVRTTGRAAVSPETLDGYAARVLDPQRRGPNAAVARPVSSRILEGVAGADPERAGAASARPEGLDLGVIAEEAAKVFGTDRALDVPHRAELSELGRLGREATYRRYAEPETDHRVDIAADGTRTFSCTAPVGASCREVCANGCEEYHDRACDQRAVDGGACNALIWLNTADTVLEDYSGEQTDPAQWTSGPIETWWDCYYETWLWKFAGEEGDEPSVVAK